MTISQLLEEANALRKPASAVIISPDAYAEIRRTGSKDPNRDWFDPNGEATLLRAGIVGWLAGTPKSPLTVFVSKVAESGKIWLSEAQHNNYLVLGVV